jgi:hypothetical protein
MFLIFFSLPERIPITCRVCTYHPITYIYDMHVHQREERLTDRLLKNTSSSMIVINRLEKEKTTWKKGFFGLYVCLFWDFLNKKDCWHRRIPINRLVVQTKNDYLLVFFNISILINKSMINRFDIWMRYDYCRLIL